MWLSQRRVLQIKSLCYSIAHKVFADESTDNISLASQANSYLLPRGSQASPGKGRDLASIGHQPLHDTCIQSCLYIRNQIDIPDDRQCVS